MSFPVEIVIQYQKREFYSSIQVAEEKYIRILFVIVNKTIPRPALSLSIHEIILFVLFAYIKSLVFTFFDVIRGGFVRIL